MDRMISFTDAPASPTEVEAMRLTKEAGCQLGEKWDVVKPSGVWIFMRDGQVAHTSRRRFYAALADATQASVTR